ncbi:MAG TPA: condensation domain-containing protein, partial [Candidatus Binatia bacterium]
FQATFALQHTPICSLKLAGMTAEDLDLGSGIANFDLHLFIVANETNLSGWLVYSKDLFNADTIGRMAGEFRHLLETIVDDPDQRISELPTLTKHDTGKLLRISNETEKERREYESARDAQLEPILSELEAMSDENASRLLDTVESWECKTPVKPHQMTHLLAKMETLSEEETAAQLSATHPLEDE